MGCRRVGSSAKSRGGRRVPGRGDECARGARIRPVGVRTEPSPARMRPCGGPRAEEPRRPEEGAGVRTARRACGDEAAQIN